MLSGGALGEDGQVTARRLAAGAASAVARCEITVTLLSVTRGGSATETPPGVPRLAQLMFGDGMEGSV